MLLGDALEGEAAQVGKVMAGIARSVALHGHPLPAPCVLLSGGETTVTLRGKGRGGRNVEFLLALAVRWRASQASGRLPTRTGSMAPTRRLAPS